MELTNPANALRIPRGRMESSVKKKYLEILQTIKKQLLTHKWSISITSGSLAVFVLFSVFYFQYFSLDDTNSNRFRSIRYASDNTSKIPDTHTPATNLPDIAPSNESTSSTLEDQVLYIETCIGDAKRIVLDHEETSLKDNSASKLISEETKETEETEETPENPVGSFRVKNDINLLNMREAPDNNATIVAKLTNISRGTVLSYDDSWAHVKTTNYEGYVATKYITITEN